jgi:hypothetical protein
MSRRMRCFNKLTKEAWNTLVEKIKADELGKLR